MAIALKYEAATGAARKGRFNDTAARKVIAEIYAMGNIETLAQSNTRAFMEAWLKRKAIETDPATHARYSAVVEDFLAYLGNRAEDDIVRLSVADITGFRDAIASRLSVSTVNLSVKSIRGALASAKQDGLITENPAERVSLLKDRNALGRRAFTMGEIKKILVECNDEWRGLILFGLYTGQRLGDLAGLTWAQIDLQENLLSLSSGKTNRRTIVPLASPVIRYLENLPSSDDPTAPLFPDSFETVRIASGRVGTLSNRFHNLLVSAGLVPKRSHESKGKGRDAGREHSGLSFHCLRHTATSLLKNAGVGEAIAMDIIGHDSSAISAKYTHIETAAKRGAIDKMPDVTKD
jgi:integrase